MSHVAEHCRRGEPNIGYLGVLSRCHFSHNIVFQNVSRESRHFMTGLVPKILVRDGGLATIGGGNHFVEIQVVEEVIDRATAYTWGVRSGPIAFMIHSGSRDGGKYIGRMWRDRACDAWPKTLKHPDSRLFPLSVAANPELVNSYLQAEATAANYGFIHRLLLAELLRCRLRQVFGDVEAPLVYDLPHNITLAEGAGWVRRKGAGPAHSGQPVIVPGSK